jgi:hypothetical protein
MSYKDKPWYRPPSYTQPREEASRPEDSSGEDDDDLDDVTSMPRPTGGREDVKPAKGSTDKTPMNYRRARPDDVIDIDDDDYDEPQ